MREARRDTDLRARAGRRGLRIRKHGHVYELRNAEGLVFSGTYRSVRLTSTNDARRAGQAARHGCGRRPPGRR
jgi:hypothetical protein